MLEGQHLAGHRGHRGAAPLCRDRWAGGALCHLGSDEGLCAGIRRLPWTHSASLSDLSCDVLAGYGWDGLHRCVVRKLSETDPWAVLADTHVALLPVT